MPNGITRGSFEQMQSSDKLNVLFDYLVNLSESQRKESGSRAESEETKEQQCQERWETCDNRFKAIEKRDNRIIGALILLNVIVPIMAYLV